MKSLLCLTALCAGGLAAQTAESPWKPFQFLMGKWTASGDFAPGSGQGGFTYEAELNNKILVRRNYAEYTKGPRAGTRHDDLLIIYVDPPDGKPRAIYFDSEGHTIRYNVALPAPNTVVYESDGTQPGPKYRLTHTLRGKNLDGKFEVAPPGAEYKTYLNWSATKQ